MIGLLGEHLSHSFSPHLHTILGNPDYQLFEVAPQDLASFLNNPNLRALNVTIPYKEKVIPFCHALTPAAAAIGAVNTMLKDSQGRWIGENTDAIGAAYLIHRAKLKLKDKKVLILGGGATSKTLHYVAEQAGAGEVLHIERRGAIRYDDLPNHRDAQIIINTTPVGMYPHGPKRLISLNDFPSLSGVIDVIYHPLRTALILDARSRGIPAAGGLAMLVGQAVAADAVFFHKEPDWQQADQILNQLEKEKTNIVLIGMPGVGKSYQGQTLAQRLHRPFVDSDVIFKQTHGAPADYIARHGEKAFRRLESEIIQELGKQTGLVIATGGGVVTRPENYDALAQNGYIYWLYRPLRYLSRRGRPLSAGGFPALRRLYGERRSLYEAWADRRIHLSKDRNAGVDLIGRDFNELFGD